MPGITIQECFRMNLCVDCDNTKCGHCGQLIADCPKYRCDRPKEAFEDCESCAFLKDFQNKMREYFKKARLHDRGTDN